MTGQTGTVADEGSEPLVASEQLERETKYDAAADFVLPALDGLVGDGGRVEAVGVRLDSVYFDTEDLTCSPGGSRCGAGPVTPTPGGS